MTKSILFNNSFYDYLLEFFDDYDYRKCKYIERLDFGRKDNLVGHQQRAFLVTWGLECAKTGKIGLELGSAGVWTPYCMATDICRPNTKYYYGMEKSGVYDENDIIRCLMSVDALDTSFFGDGFFSLICSNHLIEHLPGNLTEIIRSWLRLLDSGGILAHIMPDNKFNDVLKMDKTHCHATDSRNFYNDVLKQLVDEKLIEILEYDNLNNNFSFDFVAKKI